MGNNPSSPGAPELAGASKIQEPPLIADEKKAKQTQKILKQLEQLKPDETDTNKINYLENLFLLFEKYKVLNRQDLAFQTKFNEKISELLKGKTNVKEILSIIENYNKVLGQQKIGNNVKANQFKKTLTEDPDFKQKIKKYKEDQIVDEKEINRIINKKLPEPWEIDLVLNYYRYKEGGSEAIMKFADKLKSTGAFLGGGLTSLYNKVASAVPNVNLKQRIKNLMNRQVASKTLQALLKKASQAKSVQEAQSAIQQLKKELNKAKIIQGDVIQGKIKQSLQKKELEAIKKAINSAIKQLQTKFQPKPAPLAIIPTQNPMLAPISTQKQQQALKKLFGDQIIKLQQLDEKKLKQKWVSKRITSNSDKNGITQQQKIKRTAQAAQINNANDLLKQYLQKKKIQPSGIQQIKQTSQTLALPAPTTTAPVAPPAPVDAAKQGLAGAGAVAQAKGQGQGKISPSPAPAPAASAPAPAKKQQGQKQAQTAQTQQKAQRINGYNDAKSNIENFFKDKYSKKIAQVD
jgi:hypothetical protein